MTIAAFLHGTLIMHKNALGQTREDRVRQSREREASVLDHINYVPVGNAVEKLKAWKKQNVKIVYISSHEVPEDVKKDTAVLKKHGFPEGEILFRKNGQEYKDIAEKLMPDVLIEDDCESIGGEAEMVYPKVRPEIKEKVKSIVVKEFGGIDHLPDDTGGLKSL